MLTRRCSKSGGGGGKSGSGGWNASLTLATAPRILKPESKKPFCRALGEIEKMACVKIIVAIREQTCMTRKKQIYTSTKKNVNTAGKTNSSFFKDFPINCDRTSAKTAYMVSLF